MTQFPYSCAKTIFTFFVVTVSTLGGISSVSAAAFERQANKPLMDVATDYFQIKSEHTHQNHEVIVALPGSYSSNTQKTYPVIYITDGYWDVSLLVKLLGGQNFDGSAPEVIVVGLSYSDANYGAQRQRDYTPGSKPTPAGGGANEFLAYLELELIPFVNSHYRVSKQKYLFGHSLGGLFSLYAMYTKPTLFDGHVALSPAAIWDNRLIEKIDKNYYKNNRSLKQNLFIAYGTEEYAEFQYGFPSYIQTLTAHNDKQLNLQIQAINGIRHASVKPIGYSYALVWLFGEYGKENMRGLEKEMLAIKEKSAADTINNQLK